jgi:nuclear pore complex protein Nup205
MTTLIVELRTLLNQVCEGRQADSIATVMMLEDSLNLNKKRMINLLDDLPKNAEHRTSLQSGKRAFEVSLVLFLVNPPFNRQSNHQ